MVLVVGTQLQRSQQQALATYLAQVHDHRLVDLLPQVGTHDLDEGDLERGDLAVPVQKYGYKSQSMPEPWCKGCESQHDACSPHTHDAHMRTEEDRERMGVQGFGTSEPNL